MTFHEIIHKLMRNNRKQYFLFFISVLLSVTFMGAYGVLQYSPTITNILIDGGSTLTIAQSMFFSSMFGIDMFLIYANHLFLKYKSKEIGVFLSLGIGRNTVKKIVMKEFNLIYMTAALIGLCLAIPFSYLCWSFLNLFLETRETAFIVGWYGLAVLTGFAILSWFLLKFINGKHLKRVDIMNILKASEENEKSKTGNLFMLIVALIIVPTGMIAFFFFNSISGMIYTLLSVACLMLATIGVYYFVIQLASIGDILKRYQVKSYYKNMIFYSLLKQKIFSYTRSIFVATLLIAFTIFGIGFSIAGFINGYSVALREPFDYTIHASNEFTGITEGNILNIAKNKDADITMLKKINSILIGMQNTYSDGYKDWSSRLAVSQSDFNSFTGNTISVTQGSYRLYYDTSMSHRADILGDKSSLIYNPTTKADILLLKGEIVKGNRLFNANSLFSSFLILHDEDFKTLFAHLDETYKLTSYMINVDDWKKNKDFEDEVMQTIVSDCDGQIFANWYNSAVFDKIDGTPNYLTYNGNETKIARVWSLYPASKLSNTTVRVEAFATYLMLMLFIAVIAFLSSVMIIVLKIISTVMGDIKVYISIQKLGMRQKEIRRIVTKQILFIYFIPTLIGCSVGAFAVYQISLVADIIYIAETMKYVWYACSILCFIQVVLFFYLSTLIKYKILLKDCKR